METTYKTTQWYNSPPIPRTLQCRQPCSWWADESFLLAIFLQDGRGGESGERGENGGVNLILPVTPSRFVTVDISSPIPSAPVRLPDPLSLLLF